MSAPPTSGGGARAVAQRLSRLAELLVTAHGRAPHRAASLVRLAGLATDRVELDLRPVPAEEIGEALFGSTVPGRWDAAGLVVHGRARSLGDAAADRAPGELLGSAVSALLVARDGTAVSCLQVGDGDVATHVDEAAGPGEEPDRSAECQGRLVDAVRRSLGLRTPPPPAPVVAATVRIWLHRVHAAAIDGAPLDPGLVDALAPPVPSTWSALRAQRAGGAWPEVVVAPEHAGWMDDGLFARECLAAFPEPTEVLVELAEVVPAGVWDHLVGSLAGLGAGGGSTEDSVGARGG